MVAAFDLTQASFLPKKAILRLDRVSQHSASFAVTTRSGVLHLVLWRLLTHTETVVPFQGGNNQQL